MWLMSTYPNMRPGYLINEYGVLYSLRDRKNLNPYKTKEGYWYYGLLSEDGKVHHYAVHRLVAWEFCPCANMYLDVNHIDGNKSNNHYTNLEWTDRKRNIQHSIDNGLSGRWRGSLTKEDVIKICELIREYPQFSPKRLKETFNINTSDRKIERIKYKETWTRISDNYF